MPLALSLAEPQDAPQIAEIHMAAFATNAMLLAQFPTPTVREGLRRSIATKALADIQDAKTTVLIVRDLAQGNYGPEQHFDTTLDIASPSPAAGKVIAFAKWAHPIAADENEYSEPAWVWPDGTNWEILDRWTKKTEEAQANAIGSRPCHRKCSRTSYAVFYVFRLKSARSISIANTISCLSHLSDALCK